MTYRAVDSFGVVHINGQIPEKEQPIIVQLHGKGLDRKDFLWDETAVFFRVGPSFKLALGPGEVATCRQSKKSRLVPGRRISGGQTLQYLGYCS